MLAFPPGEMPTALPKTMHFPGQLLFLTFSINSYIATEVTMTKKLGAGKEKEALFLDVLNEARAATSCRRRALRPRGPEARAQREDSARARGEMVAALWPGLGPLGTARKEHQHGWVDIAGRSFPRNHCHYY